jgi:D-tyrosyl-tRNA(Tyr) deacylase
MQTLLQRVSQASVTVDQAIVGQIAQGLLVLICAEQGDTETISRRMLEKILKLRIFSDEAGKMNLSVQDIKGSLLIVSQFTLAADTSTMDLSSWHGIADSRFKQEYLLRT